jgi:hypothetical protein
VEASTPPTLSTGSDDSFLGVDKAIPVYVPCGTLSAYQAAAGWTDFTNLVDPCATQPQVVTLAAGWNWFSCNVEVSLEDLQAALVNAMPGATSITIKSSDGNSRYNGSRWRNNNFTWNVNQMYMIQVLSPCQISLDGSPVDPALHPITIHSGANWIAFPLSSAMTLDEAFANFDVANGDVIRSSSGSARYTNRWRTTGLDGLEPNQGYIYTSSPNVTGDRTLTFPSSK